MKTTTTVLVLCTVIMLVLAFAPVNAATLIGQWDFNGSNPLDNKAPGYNWSAMTLHTPGYGGGATPGVSSGVLSLAPYVRGGGYDHAWASAMLSTDLGSGNYFKEMTQVVWVQTSAWDASYWGRLTSMSKFSSNEYDPQGPTQVGNESSELTDLLGRGSQVYGMWQNPDGTTGSDRYLPRWQNAIHSNEWVEMALVVRWSGARFTYDQYIGSASSPLALIKTETWPTDAQMDAYGQAGTASLVVPTRTVYDGFALMDYNWSLSGTAAAVEFDEARVYSGALTMNEIAALTPNAVPEPSALCALAFGGVGLVGFVSRRRR